MSELTVLSGFDDFISEPQPLGIMVKSFSDVGSVTSLNYGKVTFTPTEIALIDEQRAIYHVKIELDRPNQHPQNAFAAIPYEEIDRVIAAALVLARAGNHGVARMKNFEASVSTADGAVRLVVFNAANGRIMSSIEAGNVPLFFQDAHKLSEVADYLSKSKRELDRIKIS
jgi:hypothetical protein